MNMPLKRCNSCNEFKPTTEFQNNIRAKDGLQARCRSCQSNANRAWREKHPERSKEIRDRWLKENRERANAYQRQWRKANPDKRRETERRYRQNHPEAIRAKKKRYNIKHLEQMQAHRRAYHKARSTPEFRAKQRELDRLNRQRHPGKRRDYMRARYKQTMQSNPEKIRIYEHRRNARKLTLPNTFTPQDWKIALEFFHGACAYCQKGPSLFDAYPTLHQEHHIPQSPDYELTGVNPGYAANNIVPACQSCNFSKGNKRPEQWIIQHFGKRKGAEIIARIQEYFDKVRH